MSWHVVIDGLDNPRGITFGSDGLLYVAEAGRGGTIRSTSPEEHLQVPPPIGPYTAGDPSGRITRCAVDGSRRAVVARGLPSSQTSLGSGGMASGVADVAFIDGTLYALVSGAGPSHGLAGTANGIVRVGGDGSWRQIVDLSAFWQTHPPAVGDPDDVEPDGTPFSMLEVGGRLLVVEPHGGTLDWVSTDGAVKRFVDLSASQGHLVPTSIAGNRGSFYVGNLGRFPVRVGAARIHEIDPGGGVAVLAARLTAVVGVAFDPDGRLYALEMTTTDGSMPAPRTGRVVRVDLLSPVPEEIAVGLTFPTGMTFGPDGRLYVSHFGFGFPPGSGQVVRIEV